MRDEMIEKLNDLFAKRAEFYAFFDENIPHIKGTQLFDFAKLDGLKCENVCENLGENSRNLNENSSESRGENADKNSPKHTKNSRNLGQKSINLRQIYTLFHKYDYAIRKLLPSIYKAYKIDTKDLKSDF